MTVVGKILVFLNLIFSLAVGAFAVMSYTASSNHAEGYKELKSRYDVVNATSSAYKAENEEVRKQHRSFREVLVKRGLKEADLKSDDYGGDMARRVVAVIDARDKTISSLKTQLTAAKELATKNDDVVKGAQGTAAASTEDVKRRDKEVADMRLAMGKLSVKNGELSRDLTKAVDQRVQAELEASTFKSQVQQLELTQRDLMRELARMKASSLASRGPVRETPGAAPTRRPTTGSNRDNPPPENVEGTVKRVDRDLVTITIGRDSGLEKGNTLHVFRLGKQPRYIGKIILVEVQAKQAVGQVQGRLTTPIKVDDTVAGSILGGL